MEEQGDFLRTILSFKCLGIDTANQRDLICILRKYKNFHFENTSDIFYFIRNQFAHSMISKREIDDAWSAGGKYIDKIIKEEIKVLVWGSSTYPKLLLRLKNPPSLLLVKGNAKFDLPTIAIVGTRTASSWGREVASRLAGMASSSGFAVVSGLAVGIDSAAHLGAVETKGITWAILPSSFDNLYPQENMTLANKIVERGGALISEYLPGTKSEADYFIQRDRIQAGLSLAVLVIETEKDGGTWHTISFAKEVGAPLFVTLTEETLDKKINNSLQTSEHRLGVKKLIKEGAEKISSDSNFSEILKYIIKNNVAT
jgi:DNA protecting protein DprA